MFHVLGCVFGQHDLRLVALSELLCLFACLAALSMVCRARVSKGIAHTLWIASAGTVAGSGIWGTHFIAMLAYDADFPVAYNIVLTSLSAFIAMAMCGVGFAQALSGIRPAIGGAVTGAAIGAMHYIGMTAVHIPADAIWDWNYVAASVVLGVVVSALAMDVAIRGGSRASYGLGAALFTLAISSLHYTGMSAVTFRFNPLIVIPDAVMAPETLAVAVASTTILVVALGLIGALIDSHLAMRGRSERHRLRAYIATLEATKGELEKTSQRLTLSLRETAAANQAKAAFLAAMSHELRTPLNAVIGFSEMMATETFGPLGNARYREYVNDIHSSGTHLLSLINDILDLSRIDAGEVQLDDEELDLHALVGDCMRMVEAKAKASGLALTSAFDDGVPHVRGDVRRLRQIVINLLANSVKFTPAGGTVCVRVMRRAAGIALAVQDTGIGIAPRDIPRALEWFGQVDSTLARKYEGAGLGLPLARQLAELHGGTLTLESQVGVGTVVTVRLPAERLVESAIAA